MQTVWFCLVAIMIAMYVVLDGFDLGAGAIHLWVAKDDGERQQVIRSIGPVWDGNEVWLLAAGGTLYFAFPALYASGFSGFYLPLMIVLWLLILRGIAVEFRGHLTSAVWLKFWDVVFAGASLLLAVFYGAALGNVVRGVPLNDQGYFFEALWTNFRLGPNTGILDWYTIIVGVAALVTLVLHGALWVALKTEGPVHDRSRAFGARHVVDRPGPDHRAHRDYIQSPAGGSRESHHPPLGLRFSGAGTVRPGRDGYGSCASMTT